MSQTINNIIKEIEIIKKNQVEILDPKSTITNVKNSLERFNSKFEQAEERINDLGNMSVQISQSLSDMWNTIRHTNIHIMGDS